MIRVGHVEYLSTLTVASVVLKNSLKNVKYRQFGVDTAYSHVLL